MKKICYLPEDMQRLIFRYLSTPTADIIRNINYKNEFEKHQLRHTNKGNVFAFLENETTRLQICFHTLNYHIRLNILKSFGLSDHLTRNELIKYCYENGIVYKVKRFNANKPKKGLIHYILKADI
jgi:hypothetical protein